MLPYSVLPWVATSAISHAYTTLRSKRVSVVPTAFNRAALPLSRAATSLYTLTNLPPHQHQSKPTDPSNPPPPQICDEMEEQMSEGGNIMDFHTIGFFPERWFDLVIVLRTDNTILYDRLAKR